LRRVWPLLAAGIGTYLLVLLAHFPAGKLTGYLEQQYEPLAFHSVSGSVFSGSAARVEREGLVVGPLNWRFRPAGLLRGRLEYRLQGSVRQHRFTGNAAIDLAGRLYISETGIELDPADLVREYSPVGFTTTGLVSVQIETLELQDGFPAALDGRLDWSEAGVTEPVGLALGQVVVLLGHEADRITGEVSNDGDTRVAGRLALSATREYSVDLQVTPGGEASYEVFEFLKSWGQPGRGGGYRLADSGTL
jgi:general secretion pathway protein N